VKPMNSEHNEVMDIEEPVVAATRVIDELFPECRAAFLSSGVLTSRRTATSDLDIVVVLDGPPAPYRETIRRHGWVVELFVHSRDTLTHFFELDAQDRRCTLAQMCADGYVLKDTGGIVSGIQDEARALINAGPPELTVEERDQRRYFLTDLLDDLRGSTDPVETVFIASHLLQTAGALALQSERRWTGAGKWMARHLENSPGDFASRLVAAFSVVLANGDKQPLIDVVSSVLSLAGGPLTEGYGAQAPAE